MDEYCCDEPDMPTSEKLFIVLGIAVLITIIYIYTSL